MYKLILTIILLFSFLQAEIIRSDLKTNNKRVILKREIDPKCKQIPITNNMFWESSYASNEVPDACKSTFITSAGQNISPMNLHKNIETYGEMEVLTYIEKMQDDESMLFIDTRDEEWYEYNSIPGAINIHYAYIMMQESFPDEYKVSLKKLGVRGTEKSYDFSQAKTILLFCNGSWCSQSPKMIKSLLALGYPAEKMKWYRGGMDDWLGLSMTTTRTKN
ncbi:rhodanese-like domain-containing protein [Sulfurovum sp.]|uniref:rhodanese-like domain-containing protein n=1 Tax=Sulfurovum sp. TaxID=1969726 RepID=UPI0028680676|nr:rhodanese-like domain-containing protein [Sulfurovum sp.]